MPTRWKPSALTRSIMAVPEGAFSYIPNMGISTCSAPADCSAVDPPSTTARSCLSVDLDEGSRDIEFELTNDLVEKPHPN
jgi:hypothetical protein